MVDLKSVHVGAQLLVRDDYSHVDGFVSGMRGFEGRIVTVSRVHNGPYGAVLIEEDPYDYYWFNEMFDLPFSEELEDLDGGCVTELLFGAEVES